MKSLANLSCHRVARHVVVRSIDSWTIQIKGV